MDSKYKLKQWQNELIRQNKRTGMTFDDVCEYVGVSYNRDIGFYVKLPMKRRMYIGIGMAYGLPLDEINRWIMTYGMKRRLYSKDISEDLVWIYLINRNYAECCKDAENATNLNNSEGSNETGSGENVKAGPRKRFNYFHEYDRCQELAFETYLTTWNGIISERVDTTDIDKKLNELDYGDNTQDLRDFVTDNNDAFKTAYTKPRRLLQSYVAHILETNSGEGAASLNSLRGWLDDSMINFLTGSAETINVIDRKGGNINRRNSGLKAVPKNRKTHISLALALGMTTDEINNYLDLMGFSPLDETVEEEKVLMECLCKWDASHPLQRLYKMKYFEGDDTVTLDAEDEKQAVSDMLMLRQEIGDMHKRKNKPFPYIKA